MFTRPFTIKRERLLSPDTQLLEDVCENERSRARMSGDTGVRLRPEQVAPLAGVYEIAPGREFTVTVTDDLVFVRGLNEPKVPLLVQSETRFMSTTTPIGLEFFKDARGTVTHVIVRGGRRLNRRRFGRTHRHRPSDLSDHRADRRRDGRSLAGADKRSDVSAHRGIRTPGWKSGAARPSLHHRIDRRLRRARWVPFLHLDQAIARNGIEVVGGMTAATPGCEPTAFNLFVFAGGRIRGHLITATMTPSRDGAAGAVRITGVDTMTVEFARYMPGDAECCPSSRVTSELQNREDRRRPDAASQTDTRQGSK